MDFSTCYRLTLISTLLVEALLAGGGVKRALKKKAARVSAARS